jgi:ribosome-binding protein aMBF1 (putative translation factor)
VNDSITPGESIRICHQNKGLSREELGKKIENYTREHLSDMENLRKSISKEVAKKLSKLFSVPAERFL